MSSHDASLRALLLAGLLVGGCDPLPPCGEGQALVAPATGGEDGEPACAPAPGAASLPSCAPGEVLSSGGGALTCRPALDLAARPTDAAERLRALQAGQAALAARLAAVSADPRVGVYVGSSALSSTGNLQSLGVDNGLQGAAKLCAATYGPGAHMCTPYELHRSASEGVFAVGVEVPPSWVYFPAWDVAPGTTVTPEEGVADSCGSYTVASQARRWFGVVMKRAPLPTGPVGLFFYGNGSTDPQQGGACVLQRPVACCR